ncbi:MAG: HNH endonuclease [Vulcanimicrobiaceae bacterium]
MIVGGAFFSAYDKMPAPLAWETFGIANGTGSFDAFLSTLASIKRVRPAQVGEIGCVALTQPFYFQSSSAVRFGRLYGPLKSFDTAEADGQALWRSLQPLVAGKSSAKPISPGVPLREPLRGSLTLVETRPGQATFRIDVEKAYEYRCAVTGERTRPALEAAHIVPWSETRRHNVQNGLLLRSDIHNLFDAGYVTVDEKLRFVVSGAIREEFENGRDYYALHGKEIRLPVHADQRPQAENLEWHRSNRFKE